MTKGILIVLFVLIVASCIVGVVVLDPWTMDVRPLEPVRLIFGLMFFGLGLGGIKSIFEA
ncbi:MAG TPA: hypothetical protein VMH91_03200 [Candidatus Paceibacterota bacterium]|nr:hypothetical protein [Candidatus Paceibacterota bacterium]